MDKVLLDTPEDEIDPLKVPIKDLLRLADYRKRLQVKLVTGFHIFISHSIENIYFL